MSEGTLARAEGTLARALTLSLQSKQYLLNGLRANSRSAFARFSSCCRSDITAGAKVRARTEETGAVWLRAPAHTVQAKSRLAADSGCGGRPRAEAASPPLTSYGTVHAIMDHELLKLILIIGATTGTDHCGSTVS